MGRQIVEVDRAHLVVDPVGPPLDGELVPDLLPQRHRAVGAVGAEQADAAQDERRDRRVELHAGGEADRADGAADLHRRQQPREHVAAEVVDGAGPGRLVERADLREVDRLPLQHLLRAQRLEVTRLLGLAGDRDDVIADLRQDLDRHRAHAAGRAGHGHRTVVGLQPVVLHQHDRLRRGEARGAERHRVERRHALGPPHDPVAGHADVLAVAAVVRDAHVVGVDDHLVAALPARVGRRFDGARHVDAGVGRVLAHDLAGAVVRQRVLVVDRRVLGPDHDVARIELVRRHLDEAARRPTSFSWNVR